MDSLLNSFKLARNKEKQIKVLAQVNNADVETIVALLRLNGLCVSKGTCSGCGKIKERYLHKRCWECFWKAYEIQEEKDRQKEIAKFLIKENCVRINKIFREMTDLTIENERLKSLI